MVNDQRYKIQTDDGVIIDARGEIPYYPEIGNPFSDWHKYVAAVTHYVTNPRFRVVDERPRCTAHRERLPALCRATRDSDPAPRGTPLHVIQLLPIPALQIVMSMAIGPCPIDEGGVLITKEHDTVQVFERHEPDWTKLDYSNDFFGSLFAEG